MCSKGTGVRKRASKQIGYLWAGAAAACLALATPLGAAAGDGTAGPVGEGGVAPTYAQQSVGFSAHQKALARIKLNWAANHQQLISVTSSSSTITRLTASNIINPSTTWVNVIALQQQQTSYWCGPATASMILSIFNVNVSQATLAAYMGTTSTNGTSRSAMAQALNHWQNTNNYWWQNLTLDSPNYSQGKTDLFNYTYWDITNGYASGYNIETYGVEGYPLWRYNNVNWRHYVAGNGIDPNHNILISDPYGGPSQNFEAAQTWYYYFNIWMAVHNHPALDQILW